MTHQELRQCGFHHRTKRDFCQIIPKRQTKPVAFEWSCKDSKCILEAALVIILLIVLLCLWSRLFRLSCWLQSFCCGIMSILKGLLRLLRLQKKPSKDVPKPCHDASVYSSCASCRSSSLERTSGNCSVVDLNSSGENLAMPHSVPAYCKYAPGTNISPSMFYKPGPCVSPRDRGDAEKQFSPNDLRCMIYGHIPCYRNSSPPRSTRKPCSPSPDPCDSVNRQSRNPSYFCKKYDIPGYPNQCSKSVKKLPTSGNNCDETFTFVKCGNRRYATDHACRQQVQKSPRQRHACQQQVQISPPRFYHNEGRPLENVDPLCNGDWRCPDSPSKVTLQFENTSVTFCPVTKRFVLHGDGHYTGDVSTHVHRDQERSKCALM